MSTTDLIGQCLAGKYRLERFIARGGFGAVFVAEQLPLGRRVAVKVLTSTSQAVRRRFLREARLQSAMDHPRSVPIFDYGVEPGGLAYLVQEFIDGCSLKSALRDRGPFEPLAAVHIALDVLDALAAAHRLGIVHRDIKPGNLMLDAGGHGVVRVLDWGIAKVVADAAVSVSMTHGGDLIGTPKYMAPEQVRCETIGPYTDLYALGCVLYELVMGRAPFIGASAVETARLHLTAPVPALDGPAAMLQPVIDRALAKSPSQRFASAAEMSAALRAAIDPKTAPARAVPPPVPAGPEVRVVPSVSALDEGEVDRSEGDGAGAVVREWDDRRARRPSAAEHAPSTTPMPPRGWLGSLFVTLGVLSILAGGWLLLTSGSVMPAVVTTAVDGAVQRLTPSAGGRHADTWRITVRAR